MTAPDPLAAALKAEVAPPPPTTVQIIIDWMHSDATGTSQGDAEQLVDLLRDAGFTLREDKP